MMWNMVCKTCNRATTRTFWFLVALVLLTGWLCYGNTALEHIGGNPNEKYVEKTIAAPSETDPEAGAALADIARERDIGAIAAAIRMREKETGGNPWRELADDLVRNKGEGLRWYALAETAISDFRQASARERNEFLETHGAVYRNLLDVDAAGDSAAACAQWLLDTPKSGDELDSLQILSGSVKSIPGKKQKYLSGMPAVWFSIEGIDEDAWLNFHTYIFPGDFWKR